MVPAVSALKNTLLLPYTHESGGLRYGSREVQNKPQFPKAKKKFAL